VAGNVPDLFRIDHSDRSAFQRARQRLLSRQETRTAKSENQLRKTS
jgi:hypothetical protein